MPSLNELHLVIFFRTVEIQHIIKAVRLESMGIVQGMDVKENIAAGFAPRLVAKGKVNGQRLGFYVGHYPALLHIDFRGCGKGNFTANPIEKIETVAMRGRMRELSFRTVRNMLSGRRDIGQVKYLVHLQQV